MTREKLFAIWAPPESIWTPWAKAVVFAHWSGWAEPAVPKGGIDAADAAWLPPPQPMAVVVDLPGALGVAYGLRLAQRGYRPVPLYSAAPWEFRFSSYAIPTPFDVEAQSPRELVDVRSVLGAIVSGAEPLWRIHLAADAPPAFLLDANRQTSYRSPRPGDFDNRSISLPTDFPSASLLSRHGLTRALLVQAHGLKPSADLAHTLGRWGGNGIEIFCRPLDGTGDATPIQVKPPGPVARLFHGLFAAAGFRRNSLGGFGGLVPTPSAGG